MIGGNGGNAAAHAISKECAAQGVVCNVVGVPKSIDNDIQLVSAAGLAWLCSRMCRLAPCHFHPGCWTLSCAASEPLCTKAPDQSSPSVAHHPAQPLNPS